MLRPRPKQPRHNKDIDNHDCGQQVEAQRAPFERFRTLLALNDEAEKDVNKDLESRKQDRATGHEDVLPASILLDSENTDTETVATHFLRRTQRDGAQKTTFMESPSVSLSSPKHHLKRTPRPEMLIQREP